ncbi:Rv3212 family protein [Corynebacterium sp. S7]
MAVAPLNRSKKDWIATGVITVIVVVVVLIAFFTAPIRSAELTPANSTHQDYGQLTVIPETLHETTRVSESSPALAPIVASGMTVGYDGHTLRAYTPAGSQAWSYSRDDELCALASAWGKVVATYRTNVGCGDVVAIDASSGNYAGTRSANAPDEVVSVSSKERVGTVSGARTELWRSDLVRTVEYGEVEAPQEAGMQPNSGCLITSALTSSDLFTVTEICGDTTWLRFQDTTPKDSRAPEIRANATISPGSVLVGTSTHVAAIYDPTTEEVIGINDSGVEVSRSKVAALGEIPTLFEPAVHSLPNHESFFDGTSLWLMNPQTMAVQTVYQGALGTGIAVDNKLLYPVEGGIAVADWDAQQVERTIPVDRGGYVGTVSLGSAGGTIVEKRGDELFFLS